MMLVTRRAAAAVLLGQVDAHKAGLGQLLVQVIVEAILVHPLVAGFNFLLGELAHHVAYHVLLFGELECNHCGSLL